MSVCQSQVSTCIARFQASLRINTQTRTGLFPEGLCLLSSSFCACQHLRTRPVTDMVASQGAMCCEDMRHAPHRP